MGIVYFNIVALKATPGRRGFPLLSKRSTPTG